MISALTRFRQHLHYSWTYRRNAVHEQYSPYTVYVCLSVSQSPVPYRVVVNSCGASFFLSLLLIAVGEFDCVKDLHSLERWQPYPHALPLVCCPSLPYFFSFERARAHGTVPCMHDRTRVQVCAPFMKRRQSSIRPAARLNGSSLPSENY